MRQLLEVAEEWEIADRVTAVEAENTPWVAHIIQRVITCNS